MRGSRSRNFHRTTFLIVAYVLIGIVLGSQLRTKPRWTGLMGGADVPLRRQIASYTCGPAALAMVCQAWGIEISQEELADLAGTTKRGTSMFCLWQAAHAVGLEMKGMKLSLKDLARANKPLIAHVRGNHYIVVFSAKDSKVSIADPAISGKIEMDIESFASIWKGYVLVVVR